MASGIAEPASSPQIVTSYIGSFGLSEPPSMAALPPSKIALPPPTPPDAPPAPPRPAPPPPPQPPRTMLATRNDDRSRMAFILPPARRLRAASALGQRGKQLL